MKHYRVINAMDTEMNGTGQRVAVIELGEVQHKDFELPSGN